MKKLLYTLTVLICLQSHAGVVYTLSVNSSGLSTRSIFNSNVQGTINPQPGDTLDIPSSYGNIWSIALERITGGTALNPVVITCRTSNTLQIGGLAAYAFKLNYCTNVKVIGLHINAQNSGNGIQASYDIHSLWIDRCTVKNTTGPGVFTKCVGDTTGVITSSFYPATLTGVKITNTKTDSTATEGFYGGSTLAGEHAPYIAAFVDGITYDSDTSLNAGWDGLQVTNGKVDKLAHIYIRGAGRLNVGGQRAGITIQDNVILTNCYDLDIANTPGSGLFVKCRGTAVIDNVKISNVATAAGEAGVYVDDKPVLLYTFPGAPYHLDTTLRLVFTNFNISNTNGNKAFLIRNLQGTERPGVVTAYCTGVPASPVTDNGGNTITFLTSPPYPIVPSKTHFTNPAIL